MPVNIYDKPVEVQYTNFMPFEAAMMAGASKQQQYDKNVAKESALAETINKVSALEPDVSKRNAILQEYEDKINTAVEGAGGDYGQLSEFMRKTNIDLNKELTRGRLASIQSNYGAAQKEFEQYNTLYEKGKINAGTLGKLKAASLQKYREQGGIGDTPSETGAYQGFTPMKANFIEKSLAEQADKFIKGWKSDKLEQGWTIDKNGLFYNRDTEERVNPNDVYKQVMTHLQSTPENLAYAQQQAELNMVGRAEESLTKTVMQETGEIGKDGKPIMAPVEVPATAEEFQQNYMESLFQGPASSAANKAGFIAQTSKSRDDWRSKQSGQKAIDDYTPVIISQGATISLGGKLKSQVADLPRNIDNTRKQLAGIDARLTTETSSSNKESLNVQRKVLQEQMDKYTQLYAEAAEESGLDSAVLSELLKAEEELPKILETPQAKKVIAALKKDGTWDGEGFKAHTKVGNLLSFMFAADKAGLTADEKAELSDYKDRHLAWYNTVSDEKKKQLEIAENYIERKAETLSYSPKLVNLQADSKKAITSNMNSSSAYDYMNIDGTMITDPDDIAKMKNFSPNDITTETIGGENWIAASVDILDSDGKVKETKKIYARPLGDNTITEAAAYELYNKGGAEGKQAAVAMMTKGFSAPLEEASQTNKDQNIPVYTMGSGGKETLAMVEYSSEFSNYRIKNTKGTTLTKKDGTEIVFKTKVAAQTFLTAYAKNKAGK